MTVDLVTGKVEFQKISPNIRILGWKMKCRDRILDLTVLLKGNLREWQKKDLPTSQERNWLTKQDLFLAMENN
jgi:hypothetical protein